MAKKIPIVGVDVTSSIGGTVQPLGPMFGGSAVSTNSLQSIVDSKPSVIYADTSILSAINIVIPKDFTRTFSDIGILSDRPSIGYSKQLSDLINSINDNRVFNFSKVVIDLANTSDNLTRVVNFIRKPEDIVVIGENLSRIVDYNRVFHDNQSIDELSRINFNKILQSTASNDDRLSILANKRLIDSISLEDFDIIDFTKGNFETINVLEELAVDFNKPLIDNISLDDSKIINFTKIRFDTVDVLEENVIDFNKALRDNNISLGDFDIIDFTKGNFETINVLEELAVDFNKPLSDVSVIQDLPALAVSKPFADLFTVNDSDTIDFTKGNFETILSSDRKENVVFSKILIDTAQPLDPLAINVEKILSDAQGTSDLDTIDFTKFNADSISSTESFTSLDITKNLFESQPNEDRSTLDFGKVAFDSITADSISRFDFVKFLADTATVEDLTNIFDGSTYAIDKTVTDFVNSNENFSKVVDFNRAFNDDQLINDILTIDLSKILESFANGGDNQAITVSLVKTENVNTDDVFNKVIEYNRLFTDAQTLQLDLTVIDLAKGLTDISLANDDDILSITKVLSDLSNISEISVIDFGKVNNDQIIAFDLFDRTVSFNRSLTEDVLQPDLPALSITKPLSDTMGHSDGPIQFDSDGWAVDYVVSGYIFDTRVVFDVIKAVADINTTADNDFFDLSKVLFDLSASQDADVIDFTKARADETIILDDDILEFDKVLADVVIEPDGPIQFDSDGWAVDYVVSGYIFDTRVVFDVIKPLTDLTDPQDANVINFVKPRTDENIILDDDILEFDKVLADAVIDNIDGPIQFDSDGWAVDYVVPGYIFDTRAIFDVIKVLSDINSTADSNFYDFTKVLFDLSDPQDTDTIDFTKILVDETIILDNTPITFTKPLTEILNDNVDGPIQFDSDGWAVDYVVSGYIFDTRVVFDVIKAVSDTVQQPDDADVFDLNKALADFNDPLDSNLINFIKILTDNATPLDNIDVFDGSTYLFVKNMPNDSIFVEDQNTNVIEFNRAFTDSINSITEAGLVSNQNYIADYFAEDYIGEVRLIA